MYVHFTYKKNPPCTCILQIHVGRTQTLNEDTEVSYLNRVYLEIENIIIPLQLQFSEAGK